MTISFVIPAYKSRYLEEAVSSILAQSQDNWELVIVNDCSPDDIQGIISHFQDDRIRYFRNAENIGGRDLVKQWNHSIGYAKGEWVVLAGDDDVYDRNFVRTVSALIDKYPDVGLVRSRVGMIDGKGEHLCDDGFFPEYESKEEFLSDWLTAKSLTCVGNFIFRKSELNKIGGFVNFPCGFCSDIATPVILSQNGVANSREVLFRFRLSDIHLSGDKSRLKDKLMATTRLYEWLRTLDYQAPGYDSKAIHQKCIYDYFNQVIKFVRLRDLPKYMQLCTLASPVEKSIMLARWMKLKIV